ncbi:MAG: AbrB/MazE/SpoVT family DNA-binding domain-containing protein [Thermoplasmata archaeon]|nr:MAG: AbrB/MazE/SpoVT family DNA-binding domain-containing protein [Thermoplasmata archaeon]
MPAVTKKYQVTIPKKVREELGIVAGEKIAFVKIKDGYKIVKLNEFIEENVKILEDIDKTVKEMKEAMGKGIK